MIRRALTGALTAGLLLIAPLPAFAQPPVTTTVVEKNVVETFVGFLASCELGQPYTITTTTTQAGHTTTFDDGRFHFTGSTIGTFVAVPLADPGLPGYTGTFTVVSGFNNNGRAVNGTSTTNTHGIGSDGSTFNNHVTDHFNTTPDGTEFFFNHCHD